MVGRRVWVIGGALALVGGALLTAGFLYANRSEDPKTSSSPKPSPVSMEAEVEQAYLRYWEVYADALLNLDEGRLEEVLTGEALETTRQLVEEQTSKNQPVRVRVEHDYRVIVAGDDFATVDDNFLSHSVRLDPRTGEPIEQDPNLKVRNSFTLRKVGGTWKVAEIIGIEDSPSS